MLDVVGDGLRVTIDQYQFNGTTTGVAIATAWDFVQLRVSLWLVVACVNTHCGVSLMLYQYYTPLYTEFHFLEVLLRILIPCMIRISTSAIS